MSEQALMHAERLYQSVLTSRMIVDCISSFNSTSTAAMSFANITIN